MRVRHADGKLERLEREPNYSAGFGSDVVKAFRKRMAFIRAAPDERALYAMKSFHYEKLKGDRAALLVEFFLTEETTDGAAQRLVEAQLLGGEWRLVRTLADRVRHTTAKDVQAFVQKYVRNYQVAVVGPDSVELGLLH